MTRFNTGGGHAEGKGNVHHTPQTSLNQNVQFVIQTEASEGDISSSLWTENNHGGYCTVGEPIAITEIGQRSEQKKQKPAPII